MGYSTRRWSSGVAATVGVGSASLLRLGRLHPAAVLGHGNLALQRTAGKQRRRHQNQKGRRLYPTRNLNWRAIAPSASHPLHPVPIHKSQKSPLASLPKTDPNRKVRRSSPISLDLPGKLDSQPSYSIVRVPPAPMPCAAICASASSNYREGPAQARTPSALPVVSPAKRLTSPDKLFA